MLVQAWPQVRTYRAGGSMDRHEHGEVSLSLVVHGGFLEHIGRRTRDYARGHVALFPAGMSHAQTFGPLGARQVTITPEVAWVDYLADCKALPSEAPHANGAVFRRLGDRLLQGTGPRRRLHRRGLPRPDAGGGRRAGPGQPVDGGSRASAGLAARRLGAHLR